jgi:hypothetical protein
MLLTEQHHPNSQRTKHFPPLGVGQVVVGADKPTPLAHILQLLTRFFPLPLPHHVLGFLLPQLRQLYRHHIYTLGKQRPRIIIRRPAHAVHVVFLLAQ